MNDLLKDFAKQNPYIEIECDGCHTKMKEPSSKVLSVDEFEFVCPTCGSTTSFSSKELSIKLQKELDKLKKLFHK